MRTSLIVLAAIALALVVFAAVNRSAAITVDVVAHTWSAVSVFWLASGVAALVAAAGLATALLARASAVRAQGKLERELKSVYARLRAAESGLPGHVGTGEAATVPGAPTPSLTAVTATTPSEDAAGDAPPAAASTPHDATAATRTPPPVPPA